MQAKVTGITEIREVKIIYSRPISENERKIHSSKNAYDVLSEVFDPQIIDYKESFYVLLLSNANEVLGICHISTGGITATLVDVRTIFQAALKANAVGMILAHNHPSGKLQPSTQDMRLTTKIKEAGKLLDIQLLDHIIVSSKGYFSFSDEGLPEIGN